MDLWQMVQADHANIEELCREVLKATGSGPNSRAQLFADLEDELERHMDAKENVLYPALAHDDRTATYLAELEREQDGIRSLLDELSADPDKNSHEWATDFKELVSAIRHAFTLEEGGVLVVARGTIPPQEAEELRRAYEREKIASYESSRWHMPQSVMPSRYGLPTGMVFGILAGIAAIGGAALAWRASQPRFKQSSPIHPVHRRPEPPFPLGPGRIDHSLERRGAAAGQASHAAQAGSRDDALLHGAGSQGKTAERPSDENWFSSANPPHAPSGLATPLQPGGLTPGGGPAASAGSIGTGGGQTGSRDTGSLKRDGR